MLFLGPSQSISANLQSAAAANGNGSTFNVDGNAVAVLQITGTFAATVNFEASNDDVNWESVYAQREGSTVLNSSTTISGLYRINCGGIKSLRARVSGFSSGTVTVTGRAMAQPTNSEVSKVDGSNFTQPVSDNGGSLTVDSTQLPGTLGQKTAANSLAVAIASDQSAVPMGGNQSATQAATWTSATALNTALSLAISGYNTISIGLIATSTITAGAVTFEVSFDNTNWFPIQLGRVDAFTVESVYTIVASQAKAWSGSVDAFLYFRARLSTAITGTGSVSLAFVGQTLPIEPVVTIGQSNAAALNVTVGGQPARSRTVDSMAVAQQTDAIMNGNTALTPKFATFTVSASGANSIVAAVSGKKIRVLAVTLMANGAVNAKFQSSATDISGLSYLVANTGMVRPFNPVGWFETAAGIVLNLNLSAAIAVSGELVYVEV